jgi:hypothetical protein
MFLARVAISGGGSYFLTDQMFFPLLVPPFRSGLAKPEVRHYRVRIIVDFPEKYAYAARIKERLPQQFFLKYSISKILNYQARSAFSSADDQIQADDRPSIV